MDITRLPSAPFARPVTASTNTGARVGVSSAVESVGGVNDADSTERPARVVQGELLGRQRTRYQSTSAFVNERNLDQARPADQSAVSSFTSRSAIYQYANNIRPESLADLTQGRSVNYFI